MKTNSHESRMLVNGKQRFAVLTVAMLLACAGTSLALDPGALPTGGQITAGSGTISQAGSQMTIDQASSKLIANWATFDIGQDAAVRFNQPNSSAVALNRIGGESPSQILGALSANGQVYLLNPAGIIFGQTAQVDVGGLVASSLNLSDADFLAGENRFAATGTAGAVLNQGAIRTADGGYVAFLAPHVGNEGSIDAANGTVLLAAGDKVSLDFTGDQLVTYTVEQGAIDALAENHGLIKADGGLVVMTAQAADQLTGAVVNNVGVIQAQTLESRAGRILLLADMTSGTTTVAGTLDASAPQGGDGGFIETSAAKVQVADGTRVTTQAASGQTGEWLIDPTNYAIMTGGDISPAALASALNVGNVVIQTADAGTQMGHIYIFESIDWSSANDLTLNAHGDITSYVAITNNGGGSLTLRADWDGNGSGSLYFGGGASISLTGGGRADLYYNPVSYAAPTDFSSVMGSTPYTAWMLVNDVYDLQAMNTNLSGAYALGRDIDASETATWNGGAGFSPVGNNPQFFTGTFDGLNQTISGLNIDRSAEYNVGLFGFADNGSVIRNVGMLGGSIEGAGYVGGLAGFSRGSISGSYATGAVTGGYNVGGLVGYKQGGSISDSYATGTVTGSDNIGGLVGPNDSASISGSYATGMVTGSNNIGGLVAYGTAGSSISQSYATGTVSGRDYVGGLIGANAGAVSGSHAEGSVSGSYDVAGLAGYNGGAISNAYATGSVSASFISGSSGAYHAGGLVGYNNGSINQTYATGTVNGQDYVGGLVGASASSISNSYAEGAVSGRDWVGGLSGYSYYSGGIDSVHASGDISGRDYIGGLIGATQGRSVTNAYAEGSVSGNNYVGGLVGYSVGGGVIDRAYATGDVSGVERVGGLIGHTGINVSNSYATGQVLGSTTYTGGLVGINDAYLIDSYATGNVAGGNNVGGLVGHSNYGGMTRVYAAGSVNGDQVVGGLAGSNFGAVTDAYAIGSVTGDMYVGGLAGYNNNYGTLNRTYAAGPVTLNPGGSYAGGLVGWTYPGSIIASSYWDTQMTGQSSAIGLNNASNTATGLTTGQMMQQASFTPFDFTSTWRIYEGNSYPVLRSLQQALLTVTANNDGKTYDGLAYSGGNGVIYSVAGASLAGSLTYGGTSQGAVNAGSYTIIPQVAMTQQDYQNWADVTWVGGTLTVDPAALTVTASNDGKSYDGLAYSGGNGVVYSGLAAGEDATVLSGTLAYGGTSQGAVLPGSYAITPNGLTSGNYTISFIDGTLTVDPAALTITASNDGKSYDGLAYSGGNGVIYSGFVTGEDETALGGTLAYGGTSQGAVLPGSYAISPAGLLSANYVIQFIDGTLTIDNDTAPIDRIVASLTSPQNSINGTHFDNLDRIIDPASLQASMGAGTGSGTLEEFAAQILVDPPCVGTLRDTVYCR